MSSSLNLNGSTVTLNDDTTYTYYQIRDASVSHNGVLIVGDGTILEFDNKASAGFASAASAITINVNGLRTNNARIRSADPDPTYEWTMPATTTYIDAEWCEFEHYTGPTSANYWGFSDCLFVGDRYITADEMLQMLNISDQIEPVQMGRMIEQSDRQIKSWLLQNSISAPTADDQLKTASFCLTTANVMTRLRVDGTRPSSLSLGSMSLSDDVEENIHNLRIEAKELVKDYIMNHGSSDRYRYIIRKVNP